jgi:hypothetical protein
VKAYADSEDFADLQEELEMSTLETKPRTQGVVYDLAEVFDQVNAGYFGGQLARPQLVWSRSPTRRKLGHYDLRTDTIMLSLSLDDSGVPGYVVEAVMYHEALHKALGAKVVQGRRYAHTAEFRARERQFREYEKSWAFLNGHVRSHTGKRGPRGRGR